MTHMSDPSEPALALSGVSHAFGARQVLCDVTFTAPKGAFVALLGVNGAGKSTLANLITQLYACRSGEIRICGVDVRKNPSLALQKLGVVFQTRALDAGMSVRRNFFYAGALHGLSAGETMSRAETLLERIGLERRLDEKVGALSGGQQRRLELVRALLHQPSFLLCDEATAGLDIRSRREVVDLAHDLAAEQGVGVLWATHLTDEVWGDDQVVVLHEGRILTSGAAADIASRADASLGEAFLALTAQRQDVPS